MNDDADVAEVAGLPDKLLMVRGKEPKRGVKTSVHKILFSMKFEKTEDDLNNVLI